MNRSVTHIVSTTDCISIYRLPFSILSFLNEINAQLRNETPSFYLCISISYTHT